MKTNPANNSNQVSEGWTLIKWELYQRRWSIFWWTVGIVLFASLILGVYPTFRDQAAQIDQSLKGFPDSAKALFTDTNDFLSPVGYLSSQMYYLLMPLIFSFLAIGLGSTLIAREEQQHTIELLLARPISRGTFVVSKATAGLVVVLIVGVITALVCAGEAAIIKFAGVSAVNVLLVTLMSLMLAILFGAIAFVLTTTRRFGRGASIGIAGMLALVGYLVSSLDQTVKWLIWPARFLPFHYYHPADILRGSFGWPEFIGMALVAIILVWLAVKLFAKRDVRLGD